MAGPAILTRAQVREIDRRAVTDYGMSGLVLMENAGRGATDLLCRLLGEGGKPAGSVLVVCGRGNNGGDGFVIARHLDIRRTAVKIVLCGDPKQLSSDAAANFAIIEKAGLPIRAFDAQQFSHDFAGAAYLVDALLGTGATGEPKSPIAEAIDAMNASGVPVFAVDIPSGLDCDTGAVARHTIRAAHTCTFVAAKPGLIVPEAAQFVGQLHVQDIGVPQRLLDDIGLKQ